MVLIIFFLSFQYFMPNCNGIRNIFYLHFPSLDLTLPKLHTLCIVFSSPFSSLQGKWQRPKQTVFLLTTFLLYTLLLGQQLTWQQPQHLAWLPHHLWPVRCDLDLEPLRPISLCQVARGHALGTWRLEPDRYRHFWALSQLDGLKVISLKLNLLSGPISDLSLHWAKSSLSYNNLLGPISPTISSLNWLYRLDLSRNFSGSVSASLNQLTRLYSVLIFM